MKTKVAARTRNGHHHHHHHHHQNQQKYATARVGSASTNKRSQRRRDFIATATGRKYSGRRESSTSIESQVIALKKTTYPNAVQQSHKLGLFAQSTKHHNGGAAHGVEHKNIKRRSANAGLDPADISEFLAKNGEFIIPFLKHRGMTSSSSEEDEGEELRDMELKHELTDEDDGIVDNHELLGPKIEEIHEAAKPLAKRHASKQDAVIEHLLKNMQKSNESASVQRNSRNSTRSRQSHKSQLANTAANAANGVAGNLSNLRSTLRKNNKHYDEALLHDLNLRFGSSEAGPANHNDRDSITSYTSAELDLPLGLTLHSSYSGLSASGKPHSRNSKTSCDVGIQANAYEIATQTLDSGHEANLEDEPLKMAMLALNVKNRRKSDYCDETEMQTLLQPQCQQEHNKQHETIITLTESEKLRMLLLPSK